MPGFSIFQRQFAAKTLEICKFDAGKGAKAFVVLLPMPVPL
jgi:hypothetical protein